MRHLRAGKINYNATSMINEDYDSVGQSNRTEYLSKSTSK